MAATLGQRIQDLVGFDYSDNTMNTEDEALETACVEVIDSIPETILLKYATSPQNLDSGTSNMDIDGRKIIRVLRFDNHGVTRVCEKVDIDEFHFITNDASSIYRPTKYSPVWTEDPETGSPKLEIFPGITGAEDEAESAKVYYIDYPTGELVDSGESIVGVPNELEHAVAIKASMYILQVLISDSVQEDEDNEMLQMLTAQLQTLQAMFTLEMQRLTGGKSES